MTPEELRALAAAVAEMRARGMSNEQVSAGFQRNNIPFQSVGELVQTLQAQGITPQGQAQQPAQQPPAPETQPPRRQPGGRGMGASAATSPGMELQPSVSENIRGTGDRPGLIQQGAANLLQGVTGSLASDALSGAERIGVAPEGTTQKFQDALQAGREDMPLVAGGLQLGGAVAGLPRVAAQKALIPAARKAGGLLGQGAAAGARRMGMGAAGQFAARGAGATAGATTVGAAGGAAEGAAVEFGERFGQEERMPGLFSLPVAGGGLIGGAGGALGAAIGQVKHVNKATRGRGLEVARAAERQTQPLPNRRRVESLVADVDERRRTAFRQFDDTPGDALPMDIPEFVRTNPTARQALNRSQSQEARKFARALNKYEADMARHRAAVKAGEPSTPPTPPKMSALLADDIRKNLGSTADAFATARPGSDLPDATLVREAQSAEEGLTDLLEQVPGFQEGIAATREARGIERGFLLGRKVRNAGADVAEDLASGQSVRLGAGTEAVPLQIPSDPQANAAFRAGLIEPEIQRLTSNPSTAQTFLDELMPGTQLYRRMRVALGGEENMKQFMQVAEHARQTGEMNKVVEALVKSVGFAFGTSLFGGAALGLIGATN